MFETVANSSREDMPPRPLVIATPAQLADALRVLSPKAFIALMLVLEHGYSRDGHVEVLGWGSRWLQEQGMLRTTAEKAARELTEKGYIRREQGPQGVLGKVLGVVPPEVFGGPAVPTGVARTDGRRVAYLTGTVFPAPTHDDSAARCSVCNIIRPHQQDSGVTTYVIARGEYVKIGSTRDLSRRLRALGKANPKVIVPEDFDPTSVLRLIGTSEEDEHVLHERFAKWHVVGEWFRPDRRMMRALSDVVFADLAV